MAMFLRWKQRQGVVALLHEMGIDEDSPSPPPNELPPNLEKLAQSNLGNAGLDVLGLQTSHAIGQYLGQVWNVKWSGAKGDGQTDDRKAFQNALDTHSMIFVPPGKYIISSPLVINDFNTIVGSGLHSSGGGVGASSWMVFTQDAGACFIPSDQTSMLLHPGFMGLTISAASSASHIWNFRTLTGLKMAFIRATTAHNVTGGFRAAKSSAGDSSWVVNWTDVEIRVTDGATKYAVDMDCSDSALMGGHYTGGRGVILRGTGGVKMIGARVDRSNGYGITISNETEAKSQHTINACQIEENKAGGVLIDGDANDLITQKWCMPLITSNHFRNPAASWDILFKNTSGPALKGGLVGGNSHNVPSTTPMFVSGDWADITTFPSAHAKA